MIAVEYAARNLIHPNHYHILEFGVWRGETLRLIKDAIDARYDASRFDVYGFDSFVGLPEDWENTPHQKGGFSNAGEIPDIEGVKFFKGWFEDTLPEYVKEAKTIALAHIDCDLYSSTKTVLKYIHPFLKPGSILVFDEWIYNWDPNFNDHEQKAFNEFAAETGIKYEAIEQVPGLDAEERVIRIIE